MATMAVMIAPSALRNVVCAQQENTDIAAKRLAVKRPALGASAAGQQAQATKHQPLRLLRGTNNSKPRTAPSPAKHASPKKAALVPEQPLAPKQAAPATAAIPANAPATPLKHHIVAYTRDQLLALNTKAIARPAGLADVPEIMPRRVIKFDCDPDCEEVLDEHRVDQRKKQIKFGKNTDGYKRFKEHVIRQGIFDKKLDPVMPDVFQTCSKRSWDGQVRKWRRLLHFYDTVNGRSDVDTARAAIAAELAHKKQEKLEKEQKKHTEALAAAVASATTEKTAISAN